MATATKKTDATEKKTEETKKITPLKMEIRRVKLPIIGISPLITHAWSEKAKKQMRDKQQRGAKSGKEAKDPNADFKAAKYTDAKGNDCVPVLAFKNAIVSAARFAGKDLPMTVLRGAFFIHGDAKGADGSDLVKLTYGECRMREDMVRVGMGTADMRYRPEYTDWSVVLTLEYNEGVISVDQIVGLVKLAGFSVGICEWRPERDGQHGRFDVDMAKLTEAAA